MRSVCMRRPAAMSTVVLAAVVFTLAGCAAVPAPSGAAVPPPARASAPAVPRDTPRPEVAVADSTPSADALRVLEAIPEPLAPGQEVPPPPSTTRSTTPATPRGTRAVAPEAAYDTLRAESGAVAAPESASDTLRAESAGDTAAVPVPAPTEPLGSGPSGTLTMPDTLSPPPVVVPPASTPSGAAPSPAAGKADEPCWRLQVAAPAEKPKADSRREAAESLLLVPFSVEFEKGLYKVRTRDCMTRTAADALKLRAADSGFEGVFLVDTHAAAATPAHKRTTRSVKKRPRR